MVRQAFIQAQRQVQSSTPIASGILQRKCGKLRKKGPLLQRSAAGPSAETVPPIVHEVLRSPGRPLDSATRAFFELRFGHDFSRVRVHTDAKAAQSARAVNARAYTVGREVVFGANQYVPRTPKGLHLLAHELAHTVQQRNSMASADVQTISNPTDLFEHEAEISAVQATNSLFVSSSTMNRAPLLVYRVPETWYRGEAAGVEPAIPGSVAHDLGDGLYLSSDQSVASQYSSIRAGSRPSAGRVLYATFERSILGRVLDLTRDARWLQYMQTRTPSGMTYEQLIRAANENYSRFFRAFLRQYNLQIESFDAIIGPEYVRGGSQLCIRNLSVQTQIRSMLRPVTPGVPSTRVGESAGETSSTRTRTTSPEGAATTEFRVNARFNVLNTTTQSGGNSVAEIEVLLSEGLEQVNQTARANGGRTLPSRLVLRITTNPQGALVAAESTTGEAAAFAETLARQALATVPRSAAGAEGATGAAAGAVRSVSPWIRGIGWAGIVLFVGLTWYQYSEATPEQRPRVLVTAGGGLAGGMLTGYVVCNLVLAIETVGWSLLICLFAAGIPGSVVGSAAAGGIYDEATATPLQQALRDLERQPDNVRRLFYALIQQATPRGGLPVTVEFIDQFIYSVPADLEDNELATLTSRIRSVGPEDSLENILRSLRLAISQLPRRQPISLPAQLNIRDIYELDIRQRYRIDAPGGGHIRLFPPLREPPEGMLPTELTPLRMQPIFEFDLGT